MGEIKERKILGAGTEFSPLRKNYWDRKYLTRLILNNI